MTWPDHVTVYHRLRTPPTPASDSINLDVLIISELHQRAAARCVEDNVIYDYRAGKKTQMPEFMYTQMERLWSAQEETMVEMRKKAAELEARVRELEVSSWDREDAVEDMGSP